MRKKYLFFVSHSYSFSIMRPLQAEIVKRGDEAAWFIEQGCENFLAPEERLLQTIRQVIDYNPFAVFAPGNLIYDFFPGIKVALFHGYAMKKRIEKIDDHFTIRGWFDMYCTQGESSTPYFKMLEKKYGFFKIYETGWCKADTFFASDLPEPAKSPIPTILYSPTFSKNICSAEELYPVIEQLAVEKRWNWLITFHPKINSADLIRKYEDLGNKYPNVCFQRYNNGLETFLKSDVMLCDSSSIIVEYMMLNRPVVTYRNTHPGDFLIDVTDKTCIGVAIERALTYPPELMENIKKYVHFHEAHCDGHNCARVLDAVSDFAANYAGKLKRKPLNLIRKLKLRLKLHYYGF